MLKLTGISHSYGKQPVLKDVSLTLQPHQRIALMGPSGVGKTTLLRVALGLLRPQKGKVENRFSKTAAVFQEPRLLPWRTAAENVNLILGDTPETLTKARQHLSALGLEDAADKYPRELSGGMQQRVGFARALANDPQIMLMDEPFGALDPLIRQQMQNELLEIQAKMKKTIVFITHDIDEAFRLGNHVAIMKDGIIHQCGTPREIMLNPATDYVKRFVQGVNRLRFVKASDIVTAECEHTSKNIPAVNGEVTLHQVIPFFENSDTVAVTDAEGNVAGYISKDAFLREIQAESKE